MLMERRPFQREIITTALEGHDVFVQAGTYEPSRISYLVTFRTGR